MKTKPDEKKQRRIFEASRQVAKDARMLLEDPGMGKDASERWTKAESLLGITHRSLQNKTRYGRFSASELYILAEAAGYAMMPMKTDNN